MIDPFVATVIFSGPTTIVSVFAVSAADALSRLLQALTATKAERPSRTPALFLEILRSIFII
jgi:hypothetical protein